jgi:SAM-dependent methyltransferase
VERESIDVAVSGLVFNFVPDEEAALREMAAVCRPGGVVAAYVWDYATGMEFLRAFWDAAVELDSGAAPLDEGVRFPICREGALADRWRQHGFTNVTSEAIEIPTKFNDFDDFWEPFLGGQGPAPTYVASLDPNRKSEVASRLRSRLQQGADGSISLSARAWAVKGHV